MLINMNNLFCSDDCYFHDAFLEELAEELPTSFGITDGLCQGGLSIEFLYGLPMAKAEIYHLLEAIRITHVTGGDHLC